MVTRLLTLLIVLPLVLSGCAKVQVSQDYAEDYRFDSTGSYSLNGSQLRDESGMIMEDQLLANRFTRAITSVMNRQGFRQSSSPQLLVSYVYRVSDMLQAEPVNPGFEFGYGRYWNYGGIGIGGTTFIRQYKQGKLVINISVASTGQLVWRGIGTREVFTDSTPDEITRGVNEMVDAVLKQFPPIL